MIALTQRLVERDEQIMALQDELDAYDRHHKELEEVITCWCICGCGCGCSCDCSYGCSCSEAVVVTVTVAFL